jgi:hypothetical protein
MAKPLWFGYPRWTLGEVRPVRVEPFVRLPFEDLQTIPTGRSEQE